MGTSYDPETEEEIDSLKGTTSTYPAEKPTDESADEPVEEQAEESVEEPAEESVEEPAEKQNEQAADEQKEQPTALQWRQLTLRLSASGIDTLPEMVIHATHPTYKVSSLPVDDAGECTLWIPDTVDALDIVLSFSETVQDDISITDMVVEGQETITIPVVIIAENE